MLVVAALAGCGGSSGGFTGSPPPPPPVPDGSAKVSFSVVIPSASQNTAAVERRREYVSSNTRSVTVTVNSGSAQIFSLTPSTNPSCVSSNGETTCSNLIAVAPPSTNDDFSFATYASADGSGTPLSVAADDNVEINEGVTNQLGTLTLNPVLASLAMNVAGTYVAGRPSNGNPINIVAKDPSGATIIAPGNYTTSANVPDPIGLALTGVGTGNFTLSTAALANPNQSATLSYNGNDGAVTVTASATGVTSQQQTITPTAQSITLTLASSASASEYLITNGPYELDFYAPGLTGTVTPSEVGYVGSFTLESTTCNASEVTFTPGAGGSVASGDGFTVSAVAAGTAISPAICTATFEDGSGQTVTATFSVTEISFSLDRRSRV